MGQSVWDAKTITLVGLGILTLVILWESHPMWGLLILAAIVIIVSKGLRKGTVQYPSGA